MCVINDRRKKASIKALCDVVKMSISEILNDSIKFRIDIGPWSIEFDLDGADN